MPAPTVAASGPVSAPLRAAAQLLSQCATVRTMLNAASSTDAFNAINYPKWDTDDADQATFNPPQITVSMAGQLIRYGGGGLTELLLEFLLPLNDDHLANSKDQLITFMNSIGAVFNELFILTGNQSEAGEFNLFVEDIETVVTPQVSDPAEIATDEGQPVLMAMYLLKVTL